MCGRPVELWLYQHFRVSDGRRKDAGRTAVLLESATTTTPEINNECDEASIGGCPTPPQGGDEGAIAGGSHHAVEDFECTTIVAPPSIIKTNGRTSSEPLNEIDKKNNNNYTGDYQRM